MAEKGRVFTGARARLIANGVKVGYATGISWQENEQVEELRVMDNIEVEEEVSVAYSVSGSVKQARIVGENARTAGLWAKVGANKDEHLTNILTLPPLTLQVEDSKTGKIVALLEQVKFTTRGGQVDAAGISYVDMNFNAIRLSDESEV